jgi:ABC-type uncharacterized transport system permease subunit
MSALAFWVSGKPKASITSVAILGLLLLVLLTAIGPALSAQGDPLSLLSDRAARIAEYVCYGIAIVLLVVAAIQAMAGERNGMMAIGGAIVFAVIGLNAREIANLLRF